MDEYKRSLHDELEWVEVEQLHAATMKISDNCFEYKKLCVSILGIAITILVKFTKDDLDYSIFVIGILISLGFWTADATAYYYQRRLRSLMDIKKNNIATRNSTAYTLTVSTPTWKEAFLNKSMSLYYFAITMFFLGAALLKCGTLGGS